MRKNEPKDETEVLFDELDKRIFEVQKSNNKESFMESCNALANTFNSIVQGTSTLLNSAQGIFQLQVEISRINSDTAVRLAEIQKSYHEFMTKEENKKEIMIKILETLKEQNNKILDKAMAVDLSKCTEQEYAYVMSTMEKTEKFTDRIMDIFDKFITQR